MNAESKYDISVIVLTYNADWNKLVNTLNSIIFQRNLNFEIVIADDGSSIRHDDKINKYFQMHNYTDYKIVNSEKNNGTCINLNNAVEIAEGKYIKPFSPGDYLYNEETLHDWTDYMDNNSSRISFGDAVYYNIPSSEINVVETSASPSNRNLYMKQTSRKKFFTNYMIANDTISGASVMMKKEVIKKYLNRIVGKVIYAEDFMLRLAVYDNVRIDYFQKPVIWYEFGIGISTSANDKWRMLLQKDFTECNKIITESDISSDSIGNKYKKLLSKEINNKIVRKIIKIIYFPGGVICRIRNKYIYDKTPTNVDFDFITRIIKEKDENAGN